MPVPFEYKEGKRLDHSFLKRVERTVFYANLLFFLKKKIHLGQSINHLHLNILKILDRMTKHSSLCFRQSKEFSYWEGFLFPFPDVLS